MPGGFPVVGYSTGGGGGAASAIIFRPGAASAGNVYGTAAEIAAQLTAANGALLVFLDDSIAPCVIPAGVVWNAQGRAEIAGLPNATRTTLEIQDTAQIRNPAYFRNAEILSDAATLPSLDYDDWTKFSAIMLQIGSTLALSAAATAPAIVVPAGELVCLVCGLFTSILSSEPSGLVPVISLTTGGAQAVFLIEESEVQGWTAEIVGGDGTTSVSWIGDASAFPIPSWPLFAGGVPAPTILDASAGVTDPSGPGTTVAAGLAALFSTGVWDPSNTPFSLGGSGNGGGGTVLGQGNMAVGGQAVVVGGASSSASGQESFIGAGAGNYSNGFRTGILAGESNITLADNSVALGGGFASSTAGMHNGAAVQANGTIAAVGDAQCFSGQVWHGQTPGAAPGESVTLTSGTLAPISAIALEVKSYTFRLSVTANDGAGNVASWDFIVMADGAGGIATIDATTAPAGFLPSLSVGVDAPTWTFVPTVTGLDNSVQWIFTDGTSTAIVNVCMALSGVEVAL